MKHAGTRTMLQQKKLFCNTASDTETVKLRAKFFEIMAI